MMPSGALDLGCRDCRNTPRLHCADCPVILRLVDRGALVKADRLMGSTGLAARLRNLEGT